jgi:hypothetical protein
MRNHGEGKDNLTAHTTQRIKGYVYRRSLRLDLTMSKFTGLLIQWWLDQGAPPVSEADRDRRQFMPWDPNFAYAQLLRNSRPNPPLPVIASCSQCVRANTKPPTQVPQRRLNNLADALITNARPATDCP